MCIRDRLTTESISIVLLDTFVALTAGLIVIPACFAYNLEPGAGPGPVSYTHLTLVKYTTCQQFSIFQLIKAYNKANITNHH